VRASTFQLLLDTGMRLIQQDGHVPSIAEIAVRSNVSRRPRTAISRAAAR
jgi:hypothetical protein